MSNSVEKGLIALNKTSETEPTPPSDVRKYFDFVYWGIQRFDQKQTEEGFRINNKPDSYDESVEFTRNFDDPDKFISVLVDFVVEKATDISLESEELLASFLEKIHYRFFNRDPSIIDHLRVEKLLKLGARANRAPEVQRWFGGNLVIGMVGGLSCMSQEDEVTLRQSLDQLSLPEQLDIINFLQTVAVRAITEGSVSRQALKRIHKLLEKMRDESDSAFTGYSVAQSLERIEREEDNPSPAGALLIMRSVNNGRLNEQLSQELIDEGDRLGRCIRSSVPLALGDSFQRTSQDVVTILDRTGLPKYFGRVSDVELNNKAIFDYRAIVRTKDAVQDPLNLSRTNISHVFNYVNYNLVYPILGDHHDTPEEIGAFWSNRIGILPANEWTELFVHKEVIDDLRDELKHTKMVAVDNAEKQNIVASNKLIAEVFAQVSGHLEELSGGVSQREHADLKSAIDQEQEEEAHEICEKFITRYRMLSEIGMVNLRELAGAAIMEDFVTKWEQLSELQLSNRRDAEVKAKENREKSAEKWDSALLPYEKLIDELGRHIPELQSGLTRLADELDAEIKTELPLVEFIPYNELLTDKKICPFPGNDTNDLPMLMQQLDRPKTREMIQNDLGISFNDFNINSKVYLLQFLAGNNQETFGRVQALLKKDPPYKKDFLVSFLSCAGDFSFGDKLIAIAEQYPPEQAGAIFKKYAGLAAAADGAQEYMKANFGKELADEPDLEDDIVRNLLGRGKKVLEDSAKRNPDEPGVLEELKHINGELLLFAHVFRGTYGKLSWDQIKGLGVEHVAGGNIPEKECDQMQRMSFNNWEELKTLMPKMYDQITLDVPLQLQGINPEGGEPLDTTWHTLKLGDIVLGFFRLDNVAPDTVYFGSMNSMPDLHGFKIGAAVLEILARETEGKLTQAHTSPKTAICRTYLKEGFVGTSLLSYHETGETLLAIEKERRPGQTHDYKLQGKSFAELEKLKGTEGTEVIEYQFSGDFTDEAYLKFLQDAQERFNNGQVLSAYVADTTQYLVDTSTNKSVVRYLAGFEPKQ